MANKPDNPKQKTMGAAVGLGIIIGVVIGVLMEDVGLGIVPSVAIGATAGAAMAGKRSVSAV